MRKIALAIPVIAAVMMLNAAPARSIEGAMSSQEGAAAKDECLLVAMNCANTTDSIQQRIDKLNSEISKGTDVYSRDEIRILQQKLDDAQRVHDYLMNNDHPVGAGLSS